MLNTQICHGSKEGNAINDFKRLPDESFDDFFVRLFENKVEYGLTCAQIAYILNSESGMSFGESKWRKDFAMFKKGREYERRKGSIGGDAEYQEKIDNLYKAKVQFQDQRREYNALLRNDARSDFLYEELIKAAYSLKPIELKPYLNDVSETEAVLCLNDWHYGLDTKNVFNSFNPSVCRFRLEKLASKVIDYLSIYKPRKLHVLVLGDLWHGSIHTSVRVSACENTVSQIMNACELLAQFLAVVSDYSPEIDVYCTYGNHARVIQNKKESQHEDNLEKLVPFWLKERFSESDRVHIVDQNIDGIILLNVLGHGIVASHGDIENFASFGTTMYTVLSKKTGVTIDYAIIGDKHHHESKDALGIESIICPSLCGTDNYANEKRLYSTPGQLMMLFTPEGGAECRMMIRLD